MPRSFLALLLGAFLTPLTAVAQSGVTAVPTLPDSSTESSIAATESRSEVEGPTVVGVPSSVHSSATSYVGAYETRRQPYGQESAVYRSPPPLRYNRVEGPVIGLQQRPLTLGSNEKVRVYGQLAYAFQLQDVRYTAGLESALYSTSSSGLKLGVAYEKQTVSPDRWKMSYLENSLASVGFRHDFFDYHEAEGVALYAVHALPASVQVTGGFRIEDHRSLSRYTNWSLFGDGPFRSNPAIEEGRLHALFASLTGGTVRDRDHLPTGTSFRLAATVADGVGGDFIYYRYETDGRLFLPLTPDTRLGLRLRGGYTTSQAPVQAQFRLGGIGSVRSYGQNRFRGTRMLLANVEYIVGGATIVDPILDDVFISGLADAGWVGTPEQVPTLDAVLPSAGVGIGLDDRRIRLDVTWPLRHVGSSDARPSVWLRIAPSF